MNQEIKPRIDSIRFYYGKTRSAPKTGDRRVTKKHGMQIRIPVKHNGAFVTNSRGKFTFRWKTIQQVYGTYWHYLLTQDEIKAHEEKYHLTKKIS